MVLTSSKTETSFDRVIFAVYLAASYKNVPSGDAFTSINADIAMLDSNEAAVIVQFVDRWAPDFPSALAEIEAAQALDDDGIEYLDQQCKAAWDWTVAIGNTLRRRAAPRSGARALASRVPQPTFPEAKRLAQGLALETGWIELPAEFALQHILERSSHQLRLEAELMSPWWGKPSDTASLRAELQHAGATGVAILYNAIALVLASETGFMDVELDELINRVGLDPRSRAERDVMRIQVWRALNLIGATRVIGARRMRVRNRATRRYEELESSDPLLTVTAFRKIGEQASFDIGVAPAAVTISVTPWLDTWRLDRRVLASFGDLLKVTKIPIGQPSGAWARAIGHALLQFWRERATTSTFARVGDKKKLTAKFRPLTRRELLELLPPKPTLASVLASPNPTRAVAYWDGAIAYLKAAGVIGYYDDGAKPRPRQGWTETWATEPLDIRPPEPEAQNLKAISDSRKQKVAQAARRSKSTS